MADNSGLPGGAAQSFGATARWAVLLAAFLGWMFDGLEMGIFPQIARPAMTQLVPEPAAKYVAKALTTASTEAVDPAVKFTFEALLRGSSDESMKTALAELRTTGANEAVRKAAVSTWNAALENQVKSWHQFIDAMFLWGAALGGLVFGWLGDKVGRVRAMACSILVYSGFTGALYFAQSPAQIAALRFTAAIGMGGEWSLGVALVMEVWKAKHHALLAGMIGAASNVGFVLVGAAGRLFPVTESSWRWVVLMGAAPALLTFLILIFVPESQKWKDSQKNAPSKPLRELFSNPRHTVLTLMAICFASVVLLGTWGAVQKIPAWVGGMPGVPATAKGSAQIASGVGAIVFCMIAPLIAVVFNRRIAFFLLCVASLVGCEWLFLGFSTYNLGFLVMTFLVGGVTAAFYGWLPLYLPELFPTRVRATAQGIAFNFGRILAGVGAIWGGTIGGSYARMGAIVALVYILGMAIIWLAPETKGKPLPE